MAFEIVVLGGSLLALPVGRWGSAGNTVVVREFATAEDIASAPIPPHVVIAGPEAVDAEVAAVVEFYPLVLVGRAGGYPRAGVRSLQELPPVKWEAFAQAARELAALQAGLMVVVDDDVDGPAYLSKVLSAAVKQRTIVGVHYNYSFASRFLDEDARGARSVIRALCTGQSAELFLDVLLGTATESRALAVELLATTAVRVRPVSGQLRAQPVFDEVWPSIARSFPNRCHAAIHRDTPYQGAVAELSDLPPTSPPSAVADTVAQMTSDSIECGRRLAIVTLLQPDAPWVLCGETASLELRFRRGSATGPVPGWRVVNEFMPRSVPAGVLPNWTPSAFTNGPVPLERAEARVVSQWLAFPEGPDLSAPDGSVRNLRDWALDVLRFENGVVGPVTENQRDFVIAMLSKVRIHEKKNRLGPVEGFKDSPAGFVVPVPASTGAAAVARVFKMSPLCGAVAMWAALEYLRASTISEKKVQASQAGRAFVWVMENRLVGSFEQVQAGVSNAYGARVLEPQPVVSLPQVWAVVAAAVLGLLLSP